MTTAEFRETVAAHEGRIFFQVATPERVGDLWVETDQQGVDDLLKFLCTDAPEFDWLDLADEPSPFRSYVTVDVLYIIPGKD